MHAAIKPQQKSHNGERRSGSLWEGLVRRKGLVRRRGL